MAVKSADPCGARDATPIGKRYVPAKDDARLPPGPRCVCGGPPAGRKDFLRPETPESFDSSRVTGPWPCNACRRRDCASTSITELRLFPACFSSFMFGGASVEAEPAAG